MKNDPIWHSNLLTQFSNITHGSTSKSFGTIRFDGGVSDDKVKENRKHLLESLPVDPDRAFLLNQVHGNEVVVIKGEEEGNVFSKREALPKADAFVTNQKGITLIVNSADCIPIFFYDPEHEVIGVAHAGWKGTSKNIVQEVLKTMKSEYNSDPSAVFMVVGPSICGQCYDISTVTDERKDWFNRLFSKEDKVVLEKKSGKISLDLKRANILFALKMGVLQTNIEVAPICTFEDERYASYRRNTQELNQSIWSYIQLNAG